MAATPPLGNDPPAHPDEPPSGPPALPLVTGHGGPSLLAARVVNHTPQPPPSMQTSNSMSDWLNFDTDAGGSLSNKPEMEGVDPTGGGIILDSMVCLSPSMMADTEPELDMQDIAAEAKAASNVPSPDLVHTADIKEESNPKPNTSSDDINPLSDIVNCSFDSIIGDFASDKPEELVTDFQSGIHFGQIISRNVAGSSENLESDVLMESVSHVPAIQDSPTNPPITLDTGDTFDSILSDLKCTTAASHAVHSADAILTSFAGTLAATDNKSPRKSDQSLNMLDMIDSISPIKTTESVQEGTAWASNDSKPHQPDETVLSSSPKEVKENGDKGSSSRVHCARQRHKLNQKAHKRSSTEANHAEDGDSNTKRRKSAVEDLLSVAASGNVGEFMAVDMGPSGDCKVGPSESLSHGINQDSVHMTITESSGYELLAPMESTLISGGGDTQLPQTQSNKPLPEESQPSECMLFPTIISSDSCPNKADPPPCPPLEVQPPMPSEPAVAPSKPPLPLEPQSSDCHQSRPPLPPDSPPASGQDCQVTPLASDTLSQPSGDRSANPPLPAGFQPSGGQKQLQSQLSFDQSQPPLPVESQPSANKPPLPDEPHPSDAQPPSVAPSVPPPEKAPKPGTTTADILDQGFEIIDELGSEDEEVAESESDEEYGPDYEEIDGMLDEGMNIMKSVPNKEKPEDKAPTTATGQEELIRPEQREKVVLKERGHDPFDILPEGWVQVTHSSGMPVYLHKASRVCTMSRPYFLGPGSARHHDMPLSAIPCFLYRKELEKEKLGLPGKCPAENGVADSSEKAAAESQPIPALNGQAAVARSQVKVESVENYKKEKTLNYLEVRKYCESLFEFNTLTIKKFKTWRERRKHAKQMKEQRRPTLPSNTKLITCPILYNEDDRPNKKKEFQLNPSGKSVTCILHEYAQHAMKVQPKYVFNEVEKSATPYSATVVINEVEYSTAFGKCKKVAKNEAARLALQVLLPEFKDIAEGSSKDTQHDLSFFDEVKIEDARVTEFSAKTGMPSPYQILCECLRRNFGMGNTQCHMEMNTLKNLKSEFTMTVGKHSATVVVKNKREGKQRAAQAILQRLHPHIHSWASLYRLYGSDSINDLRTNKEEEDVTSLHPRERQNQPNFAVLNKLRSEMKKMQDRRSAMKAKVKGKLEMEPGTTMTSVAAVDL